MMMFQTFTTLAALVLFASNAALAAPQGPGVTRQLQVTREEARGLGVTRGLQQIREPMGNDKI